MLGLESVLGTGLARRAVDAAFLRFARRRTRRLDHQSAQKSQEHTLSGLLRTARDTRFGKHHGFASIRTVSDFQRQVPLRTYEQFWNDYGKQAYPYFGGLTWPGPIRYLALSSGTTNGSTKYLPVSPAMLASNRRAARTALGWFRAAHPGASLVTGRMFFLGGSTDLEVQGSGESSVWAGDLSGIMARELPPILRPYAFPPLHLALERDWDRKVQLLAEQSARLPITLVSGVPAWLLVLFERLLQITGRERIVDVWPQLRVVLHGGTCFEPYRRLFRRLVGEAVSFVDIYAASEGFIAAEDPRYGLLRLIPDHGIFFEFVPVDELDQGEATRHTMAEIVPGVQYAVVVTTCAGLWGYVLGDTVCFEQREPPLLRFTGRTRQFLSAFGEHLIAEEVERAVTTAAQATGAEIVEFHVGPVFPDACGTAGTHRYLVEFARAPNALSAFARKVDAALCQINDDYRAHRAGDMALQDPKVVSVPRGGFADWMRSRDQLGGQHKVPRLDNTGHVGEDIMKWITRQGPSVDAILPAAYTTP